MTSLFLKVIIITAGLWQARDTEMLKLFLLTTDFLLSLLRFCQLADLFCKTEVWMCICLFLYNKRIFILTTLRTVGMAFL